MKRQLLILFSGFLFALGLGISEMTRPEKVLGFLDIFGNWDPSLAFVMGGAIVVYAVGLKLKDHRDAPSFSKRFRIPTNTQITPSLIIGSALFGIGWGLAGFCPGPGIVAASGLVTPALFFLPALVVGILIHRWLLT